MSRKLIAYVSALLLAGSACDDPAPVVLGKRPLGPDLDASEHVDADHDRKDAERNEEHEREEAHEEEEEH